MVLDAHAFIEKWQGSGGAELANSQSFLNDLYRLLDVPPHEPTTGRIDLYKAGCLVLESKQGSEQKAKTEEDELIAKGQAPKKRMGTAVRGTPGWEGAMSRAQPSGTICESAANRRWVAPVLDHRGCGALF